VSHDLDQVRRLADRVTVLDRSIVSEGTPAETLALEQVMALLPSGAARVTTAPPPSRAERHRERHAAGAPSVGAADPRSAEKAR
jgi:ABC-type Mn2+/Zn2+ transport system ATPase subunit